VLAGLAGVAVVVAVCAGISLLFLQYLVTKQYQPAKQAAPDEPLGRPGGDRRRSSSAYPYWEPQTRIRDGTKSVFAYQSGLGPYLEHLLAARLSEHHGVNLYTDPDAARRVLCAKNRDLDLWPWVDPARQVPERSRAAGIPWPVLARLVRRLEQL
jgi:hypothetical protein